MVPDPRTVGLARQSEGFLRRFARQARIARLRIVSTGDGARFLSFWKLQALGWTSFCALLVVYRLPVSPTGRELLATTVSVVSMFIGSCVLRPICRLMLRRSPPWITLEAGAFAASVVVGIATSLALRFVAGRFGVIPVRPWRVPALQDTVVLFLWSSLYFSIKQWQRLVDARERLLRADAAVRDARLAALRYQLNPHFLFNALNVVSTLVVQGEEAAATRMLAQISTFLRATLAEGSPEVPLSEEIALTDRYLAIEQARLAGRLRVHLAVDPDARHAVVPSLLLQPLVENAVRHGIAPLVEGGTLDIRCVVQHARLSITVTNSGPPGAAQRADATRGIGLSNITERLRTLYGADHDFALAWPDAGGCQATVRLPFRREAPCAS
jgi:hypothetical protein